MKDFKNFSIARKLLTGFFCYGNHSAHHWCNGYIWNDKD